MSNRTRIRIAMPCSLHRHRSLCPAPTNVIKLLRADMAAGEPSVRKRRLLPNRCSSFPPSFSRGKNPPVVRVPAGKKERSMGIRGLHPVVVLDLGIPVYW